MHEETTLNGTFESLCLEQHFSLKVLLILKGIPLYYASPSVYKCLLSLSPLLSFLCLALGSYFSLWWDSAHHKSYNGAIYTSVQAGPMLGLGWGYLHLLSRLDLNKKFDVNTTPNVSSVCYTSRPQPCVPHSRLRLVECQPALSPTLELSQAGLTAVS